MHYVVVGGGHASGGAAGHQVAAGASGLGLVLLAAVVALPATRGWVRRVVGLLVAAAAAGTIALAAHVLADPAGAAGARHIGVVSFSPNPQVKAAASGWPWVDVCAGLLALAAGALTLVRSSSWPAMGRRYEAGRRPSGSGGEASMWDRLDRGDDPTL